MEVAGSVDAMLVQFQLMSNDSYVITGFFHGYFSRSFTMSAAIAIDKSRSSLTVVGNELTDGIDTPGSVLLELDRRYDQIVINN